MIVFVFFLVFYVFGDEYSPPPLPPLPPLPFSSLPCLLFFSPPTRPLFLPPSPPPPSPPPPQKNPLLTLPCLLLPPPLSISSPLSPPPFSRFCFPRRPPTCARLPPFSLYIYISPPSPLFSPRPSPSLSISLHEWKPFVCCNILCVIDIKGTAEREAKFQSMKREAARLSGTRGSFFAFHGSGADNWHGILHDGLKNMSGEFYGWLVS